MTKVNTLSHLKTKSLGPGKYFDGRGLMLVKSRKEVGKWMLRLTVGGKRREMGLGRWPDVSISEARDRASDARRQLRDGSLSACPMVGKDLFLAAMPIAAWAIGQFFSALMQGPGK